MRTTGINHLALVCRDMEETVAFYAGVLGMPRRIYTYEADRGFEIWNQISSTGVLFQAAAIACFLLNVVRSLFRGKPAGDDPWDAWTLEWSTTSPPPGTSVTGTCRHRPRSPSRSR